MSDVAFTKADLLELGAELAEADDVVTGVRNAAGGVVNEMSPILAWLDSMPASRRTKGTDRRLATGTQLLEAARLEASAADIWQETWLDALAAAMVGAPVAAERVALNDAAGKVLDAALDVYMRAMAAAERAGWQWD